MSFLRRRFGGGEESVEASSTDVSREPTPDPDRSSNLRVITAEKLKTLKDGHKKKIVKSSKKRNAWIFGLGGVFGVVVAAFFAQSNDLVDLRGLESSINFEGLLESLPSGFVRDAQQLQVCESLGDFLPPRKKGREVCIGTGQNAYSFRSVETRTRRRELRFLRRRSTCAIARCQSLASRHHDPGGYFHWP